MTGEVPQEDAGNSPAAGMGWESERATERAKISIRGMAILILPALVFWLRMHSPTLAISNALIAALIGGALLMTIAEAVYLYRPGSADIPPWFKYVTVVGDIGFISVLIYYTGGARSPFFFVYFVFLISNCLRYGLRMSLFVALAVNILYVVVLGLAPAAEQQASVLGGEGLKILAFWAVAFYGGSVSERLRRQASQLRIYEESLLELRARLRNAPSPANKDHSADITTGAPAASGKEAAL